MSHFDYLDGREHNSHIFLVITANYKIRCGPVIVPDFHAHRERVAKTLNVDPDAMREFRISIPIHSPTVDDGIPAGFLIFKIDNDQYLVIDPDHHLVKTIFLSAAAALFAARKLALR
ncbi:hypothetical protein MOV66_02620 [Agrobacterium sp. SHOUNA12C]|nr:hypothetical protein [Agrobacterium sp. BETTINA12B]MCJ9755527.1 hypothetical protein [Agrobacterium sp. SHOUNA12C]NTG34765.1 hypothetical protein [Rhizobium rhizogenes]NTG54014.1 hypothetical protein [Rhizobium rhizogenes]